MDSVPIRQIQIQTQVYDAQRLKNRPLSLTHRPPSRCGAQMSHIRGALLPLSRFHHPILDAASDYGEPI